MTKHAILHRINREVLYGERTFDLRFEGNEKLSPSEFWNFLREENSQRKGTKARGEYQVAKAQRDTAYTSSLQASQPSPGFQAR